MSHYPGYSSSHVGSGKERLMSRIDDVELNLESPLRLKLAEDQGQYWTSPAHARSACEQAWTWVLGTAQSPSRIPGRLRI